MILSEIEKSGRRVAAYFQFLGRVFYFNRENGAFLFFAFSLIANGLPLNYSNLEYLSN